MWAGAPESLSVVLTFSPAVADEQLMYATGGARSPRPATYVWGWNGVKAPSNVAVAFITGEWWRDLDTARAASAGPDAQLADHTALAERYWRLATLSPPAFAPRASFYDRCFPLALASWRAGIAAATPATPPADLARAHERLAGLYLAQGNREGGAAAQTYLQLAVDELAAAVALDPADGDLAASATALRQQLAEAAAGRGDGVGAAVHTARLTALAAGRAAPSAEQEAQQRALTQAEAAVTSGDLVGARRLLVEAFGAEVLALPDARPPSVSQALLEIRTRPGHREIALQFVDGDRGGSAGEVIAQATGALQRVAPVVSASGGLTVTLTYSDPADLVAAQSRLAAALPPLPEMALLSSALSTRRLAWPEQADLLAWVSRYEERVDLSRSAAVWEGEAAKLEAAAAEAEASGDALNRLRAALWRGDARAWRDLGGLSRVTYRAELREQGAGPEWLQDRVHQFYQEGSTDREWVVRAGETRQLEAAILGWRYDRLALLAGAGVLVTTLVAALLWLLSR